MCSPWDTSSEHLNDCGGGWGIRPYGRTYPWLLARFASDGGNFRGSGEVALLAVWKASGRDKADGSLFLRHKQKTRPLGALLSETDQEIT